MAPRDATLRARLLETFRVEAAEHLDALSSSLLALDPGAPDAGLLETTFREMHTLKGAARSVGLLQIERLCQAAEALLSGLTRGRVPLSPAAVAALEETVRGVSELIADADAGADEALVGRLERLSTGAQPVARHEPPPRSAAEGPVARAGAADTIRLPAAKLDALLVRGEELLTLKAAADDRVVEADELLYEVRRCRRGLAPGGRDETLRLDAGLRAVEGRARALVDRLLRDRRAIRAGVDELLEQTRRARMRPASTVLDVFPRMVRDLASEQGKQVEWVAAGADLEIDSKVLEAVKDPLIHLVRNAIDHGVEAPAERTAAGKPASGRVSATVAALEGGRVEVAVSDDGRGIDLPRVRDAAVRSRALTPDTARGLSDEAALELVYRSGLSTSPMITRLSGHGLGLAIVRDRVEQLGGGVAVDSRPGAGTTVRMTLPASIASFRGVLVRAGERKFLIPVEAVEVVVGAGEPGRTTIPWYGDAVQVAPLVELLGLGDAGESPACLIVAAAGRRAGLLVDEVIGDREVLVKELPPPLVRVRNVAAAGLLGPGELVLILRPADLVKSIGAATFPSGSAAGARRGGSILVVDDAPTTLAMERNLLEAAGYRVEVAADGEAAWEALESGDFELVVSDVDMPRLDGFELTARIRAEPRLAALPVILVTALETREDKERGLDVGANAYVVKSSFDQSNLLEIIERLGVRPLERSAP